MVKKIKITKKDIKDWFIILRIRITNFIKEHKYISAAIGVFLLSCIVYLIAFAEDDTYAGYVTTTVSVTPKSVTSSRNIEQINSFSTIVYDISYNLSVNNLPDEGLIRNSVIIEAEFNEGIDAEWVTYSDETTEYALSDDKRKLTLTVYSVKVGESLSKQIYLKVNNVQGDGNVDTPEVKTTIKAKESTSNYSNIENIDTSVNNSKEVNLTYELLGGTAYNSEYCENGRCAPFGIILGINEGDLVSQNSLEGLYFNPSIDLTLTASQKGGAEQLEILTETEEIKHYGVYNSSLNLINGMPDSAYDSGSVSLTSDTSSDATGSGIEVNTPEIYLLGSKNISLKIGEEYTEYGIATGSDGSAICKTSSTNCTRTIKKGEQIVTSVSTVSEGTYNISYEYKQDSNTSVILKRTVIISGEKTTATSGNDIYTLSGNENVILPAGSKYSIGGILKNNSSNNVLYRYEVKSSTNEILKDEDDNPISSIEAEGVYTITYTILDSEGNTLKDSEEKDLTLTRTVKIGLEKIKAQTLKASSIHASVGSEIPASSVILDSVPCTDCEVTYYSDSNLTTEIGNLDSSKAGTYYVKYSVTDSNGFELNVINTINFQAIYKLHIENFKSNGSINLYNNNLVVLGTYYVNANSIRSSEDTSDITVKLTSKLTSELTSVEKYAEVTNKYYSEGTKTNEFSFYQSDETELTKLTDQDTIAYGEEVILGTKFEYLTDGDDDISNLENTITLPASQFTMSTYTAETSVEYYLSINGKRIESQDSDDGSLNYISGTDDEGNPTYETLEDIGNFVIEFDEDDDGYLSSIKYTIEDDIKPGTSIDFKVRLKNGVKNHGESLNATSAISYTQNGSGKSLDDEQASIKITAFKARTSLLVNNCDYDVIINGASADEQISTWSIYPSVNMPAASINTNIAGFSTVNSIVIKVELPAGINYVYNENYDIPVESNNGKTLTYTIKNKTINEWIDPIVFETNYDVDIPSGSNLEVAATITATASTGISDVSSDDLRTSKRIVTYQNNEEIATTMYTTHHAVSKDTSFDVNTEIYKNIETNYSNLEIVTILPYNDETKESNFTGTYQITNIPNNALCTTEENITENKLLSQEIQWITCTELEEEDYEDVTALKLSNITLDEDNKYSSLSFNIEPTDNKTDDFYTIKSYLVINDQNKTVKIPSLTVSVISKKITGTVWEDFDANGLMDSDEKKVSDVILKLYDAETDELVTSSISDATGKYSLSDLEPGSYYIVAEYNTAKYGVTTYAAGVDKSIYSSFKTYEEDEDDSLDNSSASEVKSYSDNADDPSEDEDGESGDSGDSKEDEEPDDEFDNSEDDNLQDDTTAATKKVVVKSDIIEIKENTKIISNINLGLTLKKEYSVKLSKYITKAIVTNNLGVSTIKDYGMTTLAKLDVKDMANLNIKVIYTLELENIGYYPGYIYNVRDYIPNGMTFNETYEENKGWTLNSEGYLENNSLFDELIAEGEKKYLTIAFDISRKEAGSFINTAVVEDDDLQILVLSQEYGDVGE